MCTKLIKQRIGLVQYFLKIEVIHWPIFAVQREHGVLTRFNVSK